MFSTEEKEEAEEDLEEAEKEEEEDGRNSVALIRAEETQEFLF